MILTVEVMGNILSNKHYDEPSVFIPENLLREMKKQNITCVEMEASALYALSAVKNYPIVCFAHLTNSMAQQEGDFEKGEEFGSLATLNLVSSVLKIVSPQNIY